jgi:hypothetical protein
MPDRERVARGRRETGEKERKGRRVKRRER